MTYEPKHRGEPVVKYRVHYLESERGWGQDYWTTDYDTPEEAAQAIADCNNQYNFNGPVPDYYIRADSKWEEVTL